MPRKKAAASGTGKKAGVLVLVLTEPLQVLKVHQHCYATQAFRQVPLESPTEMG
jgi:hypothetical protein